MNIVHAQLVCTVLIISAAVGLTEARGYRQGKIKVRYGGRIVNGVRASIASFPFLVSIQKKQYSWMHFCGGSIFSPTIILTACHCVVQGQKIDGGRWTIADTSRMRVLAGASDLTRPTPGQQAAKISKAMAHPKCSNFPRVNGVYNYDVGVMFLQTPLIFSNTVQPFKLLSNDLNKALAKLKQLVVNKIHCSTPGWGFTSEQNAATSKELMMATVQLMTSDECRRRFCVLANSHCQTDFYGIHQMCVVSADSSDCYGDSGGPLVCNGYLVGTVSYGHHCYPGWPTVYQHTLPIMEILKMATGKVRPTRTFGFAVPASFEESNDSFESATPSRTGRNESLIAIDYS